jgi:glycosyltransferase involved in cell wall biosynthesis
MAKEPIRLLRLIARLNVGGPAIHTQLLTHYMKDRGYNTLLVTGREEAREGNMLYLSKEKGIEPVIIEELSREIRPWRDWTSYKKICKLIEEFKPHIVHTHTAKAGALGRMAAAKYKVPVVVHTFHGHVLKGEFGPIKSEIFRQIEKFLARRTDRLIFISGTGKEELVAMGVAPPEKFEVVYLGLELEKFRNAKAQRGKIRTEIGLSEKDYLVGMVARLASIKNHSEFIEAGRRILPSHPDIHFVVIGDGPARPAIEAEARQMGIDKQMHFIGMREDMVQVHADLDLAVLTSKNEGLPVAFLESLSAGNPILGSDVGATRELKKPGYPVGTYILGNVEELVIAILDIYAGREAYEAEGREVKDAVIRRFSINRLVDDLDGLYRRLLAEKGISV